MLVLSSDWPSFLTSFFLDPILALLCVFWLAVAFGPLLLKFLNYRPVTWRAVVHAAWNFVAVGCWITFGNLAWDASKSRLISPPLAILIEVALFAVVVGGLHLLARWYPEEVP